MKAVKCAKQLCLWLGIGLFALELAHKWSHRKDVPVCPKAHYVWHNKMCWPQAYVERQNYTPSPAPEWPQDVKKHKKPLRWLHWRYDVFRHNWHEQTMTGPVYLAWGEADELKDALEARRAEMAAEIDAQFFRLNIMLVAFPILGFLVLLGALGI